MNSEDQIRVKRKRHRETQGEKQAKPPVADRLLSPSSSGKKLRVVKKQLSISSYGSLLG